MASSVSSMLLRDFFCASRWTSIRFKYVSHWRFLSGLLVMVFNFIRMKPEDRNAAGFFGAAMRLSSVLGIFGANVGHSERTYFSYTLLTVKFHAKMTFFNRMGSTGPSGHGPFKAPTLDKGA